MVAVGFLWLFKGVGVKITCSRRYWSSSGSSSWVKNSRIFLSEKAGGFPFKPQIWGFFVVVCFVTLSRVHYQQSLVSSVSEELSTGLGLRTASNQDRIRNVVSWTKLYFAFYISFALLTICFMSCLSKRAVFLWVSWEGTPEDAEITSYPRLSCLASGFAL